jgi:peptidoglycan/LPS O-acetylase OafA/YrhL
MLLTAHILPLVAQPTAQKTLIIDVPAELCMSNGWRNLLLIQNWFRFEEMCNLHSHHIGTDFELFLIAPFLLILLWRKPKKGYAVMISLGLLATILRFYETYTKSLTYFVPFSAKLSTLIQTANYLYTLPTHRFTVYGIGLTLGFFLRQNRGVKVNVFFGQSVSIIAIALIIGACKKMNGMNVAYDGLLHATFAAFAPILACLPVAWIILLSHSGHSSELR